MVYTNDYQPNFNRMGQRTETICLIWRNWLVAKYLRVSCVVFNVVSCYLSQQKLY